MFMVIVLAALSAAAIFSTVAALRNDGYRRIPTDPSRLDAQDHRALLPHTRLA